MYSIVGIAIKNFKGFKDVSIDFTESGLPRDKFVITGPQGSGKSTLVDAIQFCAYGLRGNTRMAPSKILPMSWNGRVEEDQSVTIKLRPISPVSTSDDEVVCERIRKKGSMSRETTPTYSDTEDEITSKPLVEDHFRQIFGSPPAADEGTMWSIRTEEMSMVAESLSNQQTSYFLEFMNLKVPAKQLNHLVSMWSKWQGQKEASVKNIPKFQQRVLDLKSAINKREEKLKLLDQQRQEIIVLIKGNSLTKIEKNSAENAREHKKILHDYEDAERIYRRKQIGLEDLSGLFNALIAKQLESKGFKIHESYDSDGIDWQAVADFCATTDKFPPEVIEDLRSFAIGIGVDTSRLNRAKENDHWETGIRDLKLAITDYKKKKAARDILIEDGITITTITEAEKKSTELQEQKEELSKLKTQIADDKTRLQAEIESHREAQTQLQASLDNKSENSTSLANQLLAQDILESIRKADEEYKRQMFDETLEKIKNFWEQIDQQGKYIPVLMENEFYLQDENGNHHHVSHDSENQEASDGESELFLVCCCLALAEKSGSKMPIVLDDCFTKVDKPTRRRLIEVVSEVFDSMLFVTNDEDKAELMENVSSGTLKLSHFEGQVDMESDIYEGWMEWVE